MEYRVLADELTSDPAALGYAGKTSAQVAALLNAVNQSVARTLIPSWEIIGATVPVEWTALTAIEKQRYQMITGAGQVDASNTNVQATFLAMFTAGTATRAALIALLNRLDSRANILGLGTVTVADVDKAKSGVW